MGTSMDELGSRYLSGVMAGVKSCLSRDSRLLDRADWAGVSGAAAAGTRHLGPRCSRAFLQV